MATLLEKIKGAGSLIASVFRYDNDTASQAVTLIGTDGLPYNASGGGGGARTYSAAANIASAAAATDIFTITGSATTTVFVTKVIISGIQTTAGLTDVQLIKRSTADTAGTSTAATAIPHDSSDAAATATCLAYTANPTTGTAVGTFRRGYVPVAGATSVVNPLIVFDFGDKGRPVVLRGIAQVLAVNLGGATLTGGTFDIAIEWFEI